MAVTKYSLRRPTYAPWGDLDEMSNRLSRLFDDSFVAPTRSGRWMPAVSVAESNDELLLTAELPGMREDDIAIELENNVLSISGEKRNAHTDEENENGGRRYHVFERSYGSFKRSFTLPRSVDGSNIVAKFEDGVLTVTLPKAAEAKGRKIQISK